MYRSQRRNTIEESDNADDESDIISFDESEISSDETTINPRIDNNENSRIDINRSSPPLKPRNKYRDTIHRLTKNQIRLVEVPQKPCNFTGGLIKYDTPVTSHTHLRNKRKKRVVKEVHVKDKETGELKKKVFLTHKKHHYDFMPTKLNNITSKERWIQFLGLNEFTQKTFYIAGAMEFIGTAIFVYMSVSIVITSNNFFDGELVGGNSQDVPINSYKISVTSGVLHFVLVSLLIIACAPASGAHLNCTITISTLFSGYSSVSRSLFYIACQIAGGIVGSSILRGVIGKEEMSKGLCTYTKGISGGDVIGNEFMFAFLNLLVAFGTALDPRQRKVLGGVTGAILIALSLGLSIVIVGGLNRNIVFGFNIARCLTPAIVLDSFFHLYPYIVGPLLATVAIGFWNFFVPSFRFFSNMSHIEERQFPSLVEESTFGSNINIPTTNTKKDNNNNDESDRYSR